MILVCISLMANSVELFIVCSLCHLYVFCYAMSIQTFCPFVLGSLGFLYWVVWEFFINFGYKSLTGCVFQVYFYQSLAYLLLNSVFKTIQSIIPFNIFLLVLHSLYCFLLPILTALIAIDLLFCQIVSNIELYILYFFSMLIF